MGKKKENEKNIGLDFPIIFENWLNLWKYKHWKLVEAKLHTWYALYSALCVRVFVFFVVVVVCLFFIFQCSWFSVSSSIFFRCSIFFFLPYRYTLDFVTYTFETPFFQHKSAFIHTKRYVRHVWDMYWTNFTSLLLGSLLLCYFVENSESAGRKKAFKCSLIWAPSTRIRRKKNWGFKNVQIRRGHGLLALFTRRESNPAARRITLALAHFVCFTRRVYKAGSGYPSAFGDNFPRA